MATSAGLCIARTRRTRTGFVLCRSVLCAKSYKIKKNRPTAAAAAASTAISLCQRAAAAAAVDGRACRRGFHAVGIAATTAAVCVKRQAIALVYGLCEARRIVVVAMG